MIDDLLRRQDEGGALIRELAAALRAGDTAEAVALRAEREEFGAETGEIIVSYGFAVC